MNLDDLPALVRPNTENAMDSTVALASGTEISASEFMRRMNNPANLRFMASAAEGWSATNPRVSCAFLQSDQFVVALAFPYGEDSYGRATSAAVVLAPTRNAAVPNGLSEDTGAALEEFLRRALPAIIRNSREDTAGPPGHDGERKKKEQD
jgi:hypothetical protein